MGGIEVSLMLHRTHNYSGSRSRARIFLTFDTHPAVGALTGVGRHLVILTHII